jgi:hypothetical protein
VEFSAPNTTVTGSGFDAVVLGTIAFTAGTGTASVLEKLVVLQSGASPAVNVAGAGGLTLRDAIAVSGAGNGMNITAGNNSILRSQLYGGGGTGKALNISSTGTALTTTLNSTILAGAGGGAGLAADTNNVGVTPQTAADQTINLRHVTIAGASNGMNLDASNTLNLGTAVGNITVNTTDSIVQGGIAKGTQPLLVPNSVTTNFTRTDQTTPAGQLFVNPGGKNFHLRQDAPVIGQGLVTGGESATDVDGDDRAAAPTDLGADEFVNKPPTAKIALKGTARDGRPTTFDASGSSDPEGASGGGIAAYFWNFGDGKTQTTTTPTVSHTYTGEGSLTATLYVADKSNLVSAPVSVPVKVIDGVDPAVVITTPKAKQKINIFKTKTVRKNGKKVKVKTKSRTKIKFAGAGKDKSGLTAVYISVEKVSNAASSTVAQGRATKRCSFLDPKKGLKRVDCTKPTLIKVKLASNGTWAYGVASSIKLSKGGYRVIAYGLDKSGLFGNSAPKANRNVSFSLR